MDEVTIEIHQTVRPVRRRAGPNLSRIILPILVLLSAVLLYLPGHSDSFDRFAVSDIGKRALIYTAHPDDEAMFFSPTILALKQQGWDISGLCMSVGKSTPGIEGQADKLINAQAMLLV